MVSVKVGFLYMAILKLVGVLHMAMSRQFKAWSCSVSAVNCKLGCSALKSLRMCWMLVLLQSKIRKISSVYLQQFIMWCLCSRYVKCRCSRCRKVSAIRPQDGAPIARTSCWIMFLLCEKQLCLVIPSENFLLCLWVYKFVVEYYPLHNP